jgi:glutathione S-transferase
MAEPYLLYDLSDSPFCMKARVCLNLKQASYDRLTLTVSRLRELRRLNQQGRVPVLVLNGKVVPDSSEIARVLEDKFPAPPLLPKDKSARAYCHLLEEWADEALAPIIGAFKWLNPRNRAAAYASVAEMASTPLPARLVALLARRRIQRRYRALGYSGQSLSHLEQRMATNLGCLDQLLGDKPFLLGKYVTLADISVFVQLAWMRKYEEGRLLEGTANVQDWMARLDEVDAIRTAI